MHVETIDLGYCSFNRPKAQVYAVARATASYSLDHSCSAADVSSFSLDLGSPCWFSICPELHIRLSISLDHNLGLVVGEKSLIEQTLSQSLEQAQLWSQLGMRAYITTVEWSFTSHTSNITLNLSASSNYTTFDDSKYSHDASSVQPPASVPVHRFNAVSTFISISRGLSGDCTSNTRDFVTTALQLLPENSSHTQTCQRKSNSMSDCQISECSEIMRVGTVVKKAVRTSQPDCKTIISLIDVCFRKVICSGSRIPRGINLNQNSQLTSLANIAPSTFIPEHGQQLSRRTYLIQPIARFLSAYSSPVSARRRSQDLAHASISSVESDDSESDQEASLTTDTCAASLWVLMSKALASKMSSTGLKPLVFDGNQKETEIGPPDLQHGILVECNIDDDCRSVSSLGSDLEDVSLFEVYSAQVSGDARTDEYDHFETSLRVSNGDPGRSEGVPNATKSFEQTGSTHNHTQADIFHLLSEDDVGLLRRRDCDHEMLNETTSSLEECSLAFSTRQYKIAEKEGPSEATAEAATTLPNSSYSLNLIDDDRNEVHSMAHMDEQYQEMLDMQETSLDDDCESITDFLLVSSCSVMEGDRPWRIPASEFAAENFQSHVNILRANLSHHSTLVTEPIGVDGHDQSTMVSGVEENAEQMNYQAPDMAILNWQLDPDQDMIYDRGHGCEEYDEGNDSLIDFEYEHTFN